MSAHGDGGKTDILLADPDATDRFGAALAALAEPGHTILLRGDLGAGKTSLARALIRTLMGDPELDVPSPSFALVQPYDGHQRVLHADLYRLADEGELEELGLFDDPEATLIVEWPERAPHLLQEADLIVDLDMADDGRARLAVLTSPRGTLAPKALLAGIKGLRAGDGH